MKAATLLAIAVLVSAASSSVCQSEAPGDDVQVLPPSATPAQSLSRCKFWARLPARDHFGTYGRRPLRSSQRQMGQRTDPETKYTENMLRATKSSGSTVLLRPQIRFDHSWDKRGYDNGAARSQAFVGADLSYKF